MGIKLSYITLAGVSTPREIFLLSDITKRERYRGERMAVKQQREIEFGVYKQNVKRKELMEEDESAGLFSGYTDPSRKQRL